MTPVLPPDISANGPALPWLFECDVCTAEIVLHTRRQRIYRQSMRVIATLHDRWSGPHLPITGCNSDLT